MPMACAETFVMPDQLGTIGAEAFYACEGMDNVVLSDETTAIGDRAFYGCKDLMYITIPESVTTIGNDVFDEINTPLLIKTTKNSNAMKYALQNGIDFQADTKYRALLIGQCDYTSGNTLPGTLNDVVNMKIMLTSGSTPYSCTTMTNLETDDMISAISSTFSGAQESDVSLFYYSGHGATGSGALIGVDGYAVYPEKLRTCLDAVPGRKIVIIDACHSGYMIGKSDAEETGDFTSAFMGGFKNRAAKSLTGDEYYVMAASHSSETSSEMISGSRRFGLFTYGLVKGAGYDYMSDAYCTVYADVNKDGIITFQEAFEYARKETLSIVDRQNAQVWPDDCDGFGFIR